MGLGIREIVETVIRNHPSDCVFAPGAVDAIMAGLPPETHHLTEWGVVDYLDHAIRAQEIYCPHEGIDRRRDFGVHPDQLPLQGWAEWAQHRGEMP